jgi:PilZ domain
MSDTGDEFVERRKEPRFASSATVRVAGIGFPSREIEARVIDISRSGLRIRSAYLFAPGTRVQITMGKTVIKAQVRYSHAVSEEEFDCGLLIEDATAGPVHI